MQNCVKSCLKVFFPRSGARVCYGAGNSQNIPSYFPSLILHSKAFEWFMRDQRSLQVQQCSWVALFREPSGLESQLDQRTVVHTSWTWVQSNSCLQLLKKLKSALHQIQKDKNLHNPANHILGQLLMAHAVAEIMMMMTRGYLQYGAYHKLHTQTKIYRTMPFWIYVYKDRSNL